MEPALSMLESPLAIWEIEAAATEEVADVTTILLELGVIVIVFVVNVLAAHPQGTTVTYVLTVTLVLTVVFVDRVTFE